MMEQFRHFTHFRRSAVGFFYALYLKATLLRNIGGLAVLSPPRKA